MINATLDVCGVVYKPVKLFQNPEGSTTGEKKLRVFVPKIGRSDIGGSEAEIL